MKKQLLITRDLVKPWRAREAVIQFRPGFMLRKGFGPTAGFKPGFSAREYQARLQGLLAAEVERAAKRHRKSVRK